MERRESFFNHKAAFAAGFLLSFALLAGLIGFQAYGRARRMAERESALASITGPREASIGWDPISLWHQSQLVDYAFPARYESKAFLQSSALPPDVKVVRSASLWMVVDDIAGATEQIGATAHQFGGFTAQAQNELRGGAEQGQITIRVPSVTFDAVRTQLRSQATKLEGERIDTRDVSKEYVDYEAALKNARAEEQQYVQLLRRAKTVREVMDVTEKLASVRERIDKTEGEFRELAGKVSMCAIEINLRREPAAAGAPEWRPIARVRAELRDGLEGLADYAAAVLAILVRLPVAVLWLLTIFYGSVWSWRAGRWLWRHSVPPPSGTE
jgi:hypothetical protein